MLKGTMVSETFYPFVDNGTQVAPEATIVVRHPARIAVYDDLAAAPRVVVVEPKDVRSYLEEITATVTKLAQEQGGTIPFTVVREVVENLIHAYFIEPAISILDHGNTIRFSDQGPGIADKERALEFGTTSATIEMKRYIRGVGSGLPYAQQWLQDKGGSLTVEDNIHNGTVVTMTLEQKASQGHDGVPQAPQDVYQTTGQASYQQFYGYQQQVAPAAPYTMPPAFPQQAWPQQTPQHAWQQASPQPWQQGYPQQFPPAAEPAYPNPWQQQGYPQAQAQPYWQHPGMQQPGTQQPYAPSYPPAPAGTATPALPELSERALWALDYLRSHESVGPRDLNVAHPLSESTWSRVLGQLKDQGYVTKQGGQKYHLTEQGSAFLGMSGR